MKPIELRSDTTTLPTPQMRKVIAEAEVGDDVYGEDPTINELERMSAGLFGMEEALFVPTGTMANQIAIMCHTRHGDNVIIGEGAHNYFYESGAGGAIAGIQFAIVGEGGLFTAADVEDALNPANHHFPPTKLVCVENTHNRSGGRLFPIDDIAAIGKLCKFWNMALHCDGARIFNASVATGIPVKEYAGHFDSISYCLSKGLGCPVGSVLIGSADFRDKAHRYRKMLGGGMRQAGILAAAGIYALNNNVERLKDDHDNAKALAEGLAANHNFDVNMDEVETNIVRARLADPELNAYKFALEAKEMGVLLNPLNKGDLRFVTHLDVTSEEITKAVGILGEVINKIK